MGNPPVLVCFRISYRWKHTQCKITENEVTMVGPALLLLAYELVIEDLGPFCMHSCLWLGPHSSTFRLTLCSQPQSSPWVCPLKPKFHYPLPLCTSGCISQVGKCIQVDRTLCTGLSVFYLVQTGFCTLF